MNEHEIRYFWTLPIGAPPASPTTHVSTGTAGPDYAFSANELLFPFRHTYEMSTPGNESPDMPFFVVTNRAGFMFPTFQGGDDVLAEHGIYDAGETVVMLKPSPRTLSLSVIIRGDDRPGFECARDLVGYIFSHEHATATDTVSDGEFPPDHTRYPSAYDVPNPFTLTCETVDCNGQVRRRHIDVAVAVIGGGDDDNGGSNLSVTSTMVLTCPFPYFYGDAVEYSMNTVAPGLEYSNAETPLVDSLVISPALPGLDEHEFRYMGTARAGLHITGVGGTPPAGGTSGFFGMCLIDTTPLNSPVGAFNVVPRLSWIRPILPDGTPIWPPVTLARWTQNVIPVTFEFDGHDRWMSVISDDKDQQLLIDPFYFEDWSRFALIPGHTYRFVAYAQCYNIAEEPVVCGAFEGGTFSYIPRYVGI